MKQNLRSSVLITALLMSVFTGCATDVGKGQSFASRDSLETDLIRGVSTKPQVLLLLGEPDGSGNAVLSSETENDEIGTTNRTRPLCLE